MTNFWKTVWYTLTHITFKGRSSRKDYLCWFLFHILFVVFLSLFISLPAKMLQPHIQDLSVFGQLTASLYFLGASVVAIIVSIWKFFADVAILVRRFHDFGKSAWWALFWYWVISIIVTVVLGVIIVVSYIMITHGFKDSTHSLSALVAQILMTISSLIYVCICLFKHGNESVNKYGEPSDLN